MDNYKKEFEYEVKVSKELKYDLEKLGIESDESMQDLAIKLLEKYVSDKKNTKDLSSILEKYRNIK